MINNIDRYTKNPDNIAVGDTVTTTDYSWVVGKCLPWDGTSKWTDEKWRVVEVSPAAGPVPESGLSNTKDYPRLNMKIKQIDGPGELWIYSAFLKLVERAKPLVPADPIVGYVRVVVDLRERANTLYTYAVPSTLKAIKKGDTITVPFGLANTPMKATVEEVSFTADNIVSIKTVLALGEPKPKVKKITYKDLWDQKHGEVFKADGSIIHYQNSKYGVLVVWDGAFSELRPQLDRSRSPLETLTFVPGVTYSLSLTRKETAQPAPTPGSLAYSASL